MKREPHPMGIVSMAALFLLGLFTGLAVLSIRSTIDFRSEPLRARVTDSIYQQNMTKLKEASQP